MNIASAISNRLLRQPSILSLASFESRSIPYEPIFLNDR